MGNDLRTLTRDRQLVTRELYPPNAFYGHDWLLKRYAGLPHHRTLKAAVEHGPWLVPSAWELDLQAPVPYLLCQSEERANLLAERSGGAKAAIAIGPLTAYLPPEPEGSRDNRPVTVAFPAHSTHRLDTTFDVPGFLSHLAAREADGHRIRVCLYWRDVQSGRAEPYEAAGFECVSAGHLYDPEFLPRLRRILRSANVVVTNEIGTHLLYAILEDRPVHVVDAEIRIASRQGDDAITNDSPEEADWRAANQRWREAFANELDTPTARQQELVTSVTGTENVRSPTELRDILDEAERAYRRERPALERFGRASRRTIHWCGSALRQQTRRR